jgi:hypothetical protein
MLLFGVSIQRGKEDSSSGIHVYITRFLKNLGATDIQTSMENDELRSRSSSDLASL